MRVAFLQQLGTTSACAENTAPLLAVAVEQRNYLRVRGEYDCAFKLINIRAELPPRARRILANLFTGFLHSGTTSACAENTHQF